MTAWIIYRLGKFAALVGPALCLAIACILSALFLWSCGVEPQLPPDQPLTTKGVPIIRVLLTSRPVTSETISTTGGYRIVSGNRMLVESMTPLALNQVTRSGKSWKIGRRTVESESIDIKPLPGSFARKDKTIYRGMMRLVPTGDKGFLVVNHVDMESYLAGVLSKELYPSWQLETYKTLAVAARTFAIHHMKTFGKTHQYDLGDSQASQVYGGFTGETDKSWAAVRKTHGVVLAYGPKKKEQIFMSQYSSACGGVVNGAYVIRNAPEIPPLAGGPKCQDCRASSRYRWKTVSIKKSDIHRVISAAYPAAKQLNSLETIKVTSTAPGARPVWINVVDPQGKTVRVRAEDLRLAILRSNIPEAKRLFSMNCKIVDAGDSIEFTQGRGFGHGVGICQWGVEGKVKRGLKAKEILDFYYPQASLFRAY